MTSENSVRRRKNNSREAILDAAQQVAVEQGAGKVSLDSVAAQAGLTKGGVLYSFSGKDELIQAMLERLTGVYQPLFEKEYRALHDQPHPALKATCRVTRKLDELHPNIAMAILAAGAQNLELLGPLKQEYAKRHRSISLEFRNRELGTLLWAAAEGLMLMHLLDLLPMDEAEKNRLLVCLEQLSDQLN